MKNIITVLSLTCLLSSIHPQKEDVFYKNYTKAVYNSVSTFQLYLVVNIHDKSTSIKKEICLTGRELLFSMQKEWNHNAYKEFKSMRKLIRNKNRTFEINSINKFEPLNRINYSKLELKEFSDKINSDSIAKSISKKENWDYYLSNEKEKVMLAHLLFNKGILTGIDECMGGMQLIYYSE